MKLNEFFKKLNEELDVESAAPKQLKVERYGDDDGGGKGPQMGTGDVWKKFKEATFKEATPSKAKAGYAVKSEDVWEFFLVPKANAKSFEYWLNARKLQWENIEDYDPSEYDGHERDEDDGEDEEEEED